MESASHKGIDGRFLNGPLGGRSVNIKFYPKHDGLLNIAPDALADFILILAGPKSAPMSSKGQTHPHSIESVFLFDATALVNELSSKGVKLGVATSVKQHLWQQAEIYPVQRNSILILSEGQRAMLAQFRLEHSGSLKLAEE
jgi:hypothetical protein